ncbi:MAG: hypothetical protein AAEJ53_09495 [Myxococcota bacterium]
MGRLGERHPEGIQSSHPGSQRPAAAQQEDLLTDALPDRVERRSQPGRRRQARRRRLAPKQPELEFVDLEKSETLCGEFGANTPHLLEQFRVRGVQRIKDFPLPHDPQRAIRAFQQPIRVLGEQRALRIGTQGGHAQPRDVARSANLGSQPCDLTRLLPLRTQPVAAETAPEDYSIDPQLLLGAMERFQRRPRIALLPGTCEQRASEEGPRHPGIRPPPKGPGKVLEENGGLYTQRYAHASRLQALARLQYRVQLQVGLEAHAPLELAEVHTAAGSLALQHTHQACRPASTRSGDGHQVGTPPAKRARGDRCRRCQRLTQ